MRFVITGEWSKNSLLRLIIGLFLGYVLLFLITSALFYFVKMDLNPDSVVRYYLGEPGVEFGQPPRPLSARVETSHMHVFAMGLLAMVLAHLLLFVPIRTGLKAPLVLLVFLTTVVHEAAGWLVRYVHPAFAWLKVGSFLAMEATLLSLVVVLAIYVARPSRNAYKDSAGG